MAGKSRWDIGVTVAYGMFVAVMLLMAYLAASQRVELVSDRYYDEGIHYQERIKALENTKRLRGKLAIDVQPAVLLFRFPKEFLPGDITGKITFYRPDDRQKDASVDIAVDTACTQRIASSSLPKGFWRVKADWKAGGSGYYAEQVVVLP